MSLSLPASITSLPPATRIVTALLVITTTLLFLLRLSLAPRDLKTFFGASGDTTLAVPWLVLVPGSVVWYPWTLVTAAFAESNLIEFLISVLSLPLAGRYLERVWGQAEFLKFVFVVAVGSNVIAVAVNIIESAVLGNSGLFLYGMSYHGLMGLQVGFLVAFTQLIPEHQVQIFGGLAKIRVKSLPMLYVTVSNVACLLGYQSPYILIQFGWLVSYFYLRFIKLNNEAGSEGVYRGDRSETFTFAGWFPSFLQKYISYATTHLFNLAVKLHILSAWTDIESGGNSSSPGGSYVLGGSGSGGNGTRAEAERRRAMALQALDQRMSSSATNNTSKTSQSLSSSTNSNPVAPISGSSPVLGGLVGAEGDVKEKVAKD